MQITVFFIAYTKKSTTLSLRVLIIRSMRVVCKLHYVFLAQVLRKHSSFAYVISQIRNKLAKRKYWTMFINRIAVHMHNF